MWKSQQQKPGAAGPMASAVEKQRGANACGPAIALLCIQSRIPAHEMVLPTFGVSLPTSINLIKIFPHGHPGDSRSRQVDSQHQQMGNQLFVFLTYNEQE